MIFRSILFLMILFFSLTSTEKVVAPICPDQSLVKGALMTSAIQSEWGYLVSSDPFVDNHRVWLVVDGPFDEMTEQSAIAKGQNFLNRTGTSFTQHGLIRSNSKIWICLYYRNDHQLIAAATPKLGASHFDKSVLQQSVHIF